MKKQAVHSSVRDSRWNTSHKRAYGIVIATLIAAKCAAQSSTSATTNSTTPFSQTNSPVVIAGTNSIAAKGTNATIKLRETVVQGRDDSLIGIAESATQGTVGAKEINDRPIMRVGEILETIPGVIITQHAGGGKANQYFLRGFNLDHGTDIAIDLDGMPLNLPSHAHGPGYSDMNIVIPEFVQRVNFEKGPYFAENGNFSSAGAAHLQFYEILPYDFVTTEAGMYGFERAAAGFTSKIGDGALTYGGEVSHDDGPWVKGDDYLKLNGIFTYSQGDAVNGYSVTGRAYHGEWNSSDQIAESAVASGQIPFYGSLDPSDGGNSQRYSLQAEWHGADEGSETKVNAYAFYYDLDLFSDFTYFLVDPVHGDQFEQKEHRITAGIDASHTLFGQVFGSDMQNTVGVQIRNDLIDNGLYRTENRQRVDKLATYDSDGGTPLNPGVFLPATARQDRIVETAVGTYYENKIQWTEKIRSQIGVRGDIYNFNVDDLDTANSGNKVNGTASPKAALIFGPWEKTELYLDGGFGFHSDDARGTTATQNLAPTPGPTTPLSGLYQTKGAEIGLRSVYVPHLQSTVSFWYLHSESELLYEGDTGETVNTPQPSDRYGIEWANYYSPTEWLTFDLDWADSTARFTRPDSDGGTRVPEAIQQVVAGGITLHDLSGFTTSLRFRYFGPRDLISTGEAKSGSTFLLNWEGRYQISKMWSVGAEIFNLLDRRDHDIDYYYASATTPAAGIAAAGGAPVNNQIHFHPVEPIQARFSVTARF